MVLGLLGAAIQTPLKSAPSFICGAWIMGSSNTNSTQISPQLQFLERGNSQFTILSSIPHAVMVVIEGRGVVAERGMGDPHSRQSGHKISNSDYLSSL